MSNQSITAQSPVPGSRKTLEDRILANPAGFQRILVAVAFVFAVLALVFVVRLFRKETALVAVAVWSAGLACIASFGAFYLKLLSPIDAGSEMRSRIRVLLLGLGGSAGLLTFLLGVWLPLDAWSSSFIPGSSSRKTPVIDIWRANLGRIAICASAVIGGLVLMFASLQLARSVERVNAGMRRLLYGYNTVLTGLLLFAILGLFNVLAYVELPPFNWFGKQIDWTPAQIHSLSRSSIDLLTKEVDGTIEVVALMPLRDQMVPYLEKLVANCKQHYKDISLQQYSIDASPDEFLRAIRQHAKLIPPGIATSQFGRDGRWGILVVYRGPDGKETAEFIKYRDLFDHVDAQGRPVTQQTNPDEARVSIRAENQIMRAITKLVQKTPLRIGFTKGHSELDSDDQGVDRQRPSIALLKEKLKARGYYEFKDVTLSSDGAKGLEDVDVLVMAGPTEALHPRAVAALGNYLNPTGTSKKGKLLLLLDRQEPKKSLDGLLTSFNVKMEDFRLLNLDDANRPDSVPALANSRSSNPVARAFVMAGRNPYLMFHSPRPVKSAGAGQGTIGVETLMITPSDVDVWEEPDLSSSPRDLYNRVVNGDLKGKRTKRNLVSVAVAVSEASPLGGAPRDQAHAMLKDQVPRMVVFGDTSWVTNQAVIGEEGNINVDMFSSCVSWLGGRSGLGPDVAPDQVRSHFTLAGKVQPTQTLRMIFLPLGLLMLTVVALGGGIWVARRR